MSAKKVKGKVTQVELAAATEKGKLCFSELEVIAILRIYTHNKCFVTEGRCFLWKISRLLPSTSAEQVSRKNSIPTSSRSGTKLQSSTHIA